jgi:signal transduction histidine kinase
MNVSHRIAARTQTIANLALAVALAVVLAAETSVAASEHHNWPVELAVGAATGTLALLRGRDRVRAAMAALAVCGAADVAGDVARVPPELGITAALALLVLGAAAIRVAAPRPAAVIAVCGVAVVVADQFILRPEFIGPKLMGVLAWGSALATGAWLRSLDARRHLAIDAARRDERLELARELHDVVAHHVAGIVIQAQAARMASRRPETLEETLAGIESAGNDALGAMRRVVSLLRDPGDAAGAATRSQQLTDLVGRFAGHGPAVQLHLPDGDEPPWPPEVATTVYRVVQEALTNVTCHAPGAANVTVTVTCDRSRVTVEVTDDAPAARGAAPWRGPGGGYGLIGMRERVEALGGTLRAGPGPGGGWAVAATLPLAAGSGA